jgi:phage gp36-like protein
MPTPTRYCEVAEVGTLGINAAAIADCEPDAISNEISAAADLMDSCFVDRFTLPLVSWDSAVRKCCAVLAGAGLLRSRGYSPEADPSVKDTLSYWMDWLDKVADGDRRPLVTDSATGGPATGFRGGRVVTAPSRGLTVRGTPRCRQPFQGD